MYTDPLKYYYNKYGIDKSLIKDIVVGDKYSAVMLHDGRLGVCANSLQDKPKKQIENNRIIMNAYFNAYLNYSGNTYSEKIDIFDKIFFQKYNDITMIGYFKSLVAKFKNENINLRIFDKKFDKDIITQQSLMFKKLKYTDCLILTGTSIANNTYSEIVNNVNDNCKIFLLGPSNILDKEILKHKNIAYIFGSIFDKFDYNTIDKIKEGLGTRSFLQYMHKVYLKK